MLASAARARKIPVEERKPEACQAFLDNVRQQIQEKAETQDSMWYRMEYEPAYDWECLPWVKDQLRTEGHYVFRQTLKTDPYSSSEWEDYLEVAWNPSIRQRWNDFSEQIHNFINRTVWA